MDLLDEGLGGDESLLEALLLDRLRGEDGVDAVVLHDLVQSLVLRLDLLLDQSLLLQLRVSDHVHLRVLNQLRTQRSSLANSPSGIHEFLFTKKNLILMNSCRY